MVLSMILNNIIILDHAVDVCMNRIRKHAWLFGSLGDVVKYQFESECIQYYCNICD